MSIKKTSSGPRRARASARKDGTARDGRRPGATATAPLPPGTRAPDFTLHSTPDQTVSLADFRGRPVILAFYPADWSPVCGDQLTLYNEVLSEFERYDAELMGISVDGVWCHAAFAQQRHFHFPLLSDFEPKGAVCRMYGVYRNEDGLSNRALFVLDGQGIVRWSYLSPMGVNPGADGILSALESLAPHDGTSRAAHVVRAGAADARPAQSAHSPQEERVP